MLCSVEEEVSVVRKRGASALICSGKGMHLSIGPIWNCRGEQSQGAYWSYLSTMPAERDDNVHPSVTCVFCVFLISRITLSGC